MHKTLLQVEAIVLQVAGDVVHMQLVCHPLTILFGLVPYHSGKELALTFVVVVLARVPTPRVHNGLNVVELDDDLVVGKVVHEVSQLGLVVDNMVIMVFQHLHLLDHRLHKILARTSVDLVVPFHTPTTSSPSLHGTLPVGKSSRPLQGTGTTVPTSVTTEHFTFATIWILSMVAPICRTILTRAPAVLPPHLVPQVPLLSQKRSELVSSEVNRTQTLLLLLWPHILGYALVEVVLGNGHPILVINLNLALLPHLLYRLGPPVHNVVISRSAIFHLHLDHISGVARCRGVIINPFPDKSRHLLALARTCDYTLGGKL